MLDTNVGKWDRAIRLLVGALLVAGSATGKIGGWGYIGIIPMLTSLMGYCPAYQVFGFSSCPMKGRKEPS